MVPIPIPHPHQSYITYLPDTNTPTPTPVTIIIHPSIPLCPLVQRNSRQIHQSINQPNTTSSPPASIHPSHSFATMSHVSALNHPTRSPCAIVPVSVCVRYGSEIWILRAIAKQGNCLFETKEGGVLLSWFVIFILFYFISLYFTLLSLIL